ncbi:MAG: transmembrane sensor [Cyclobacteriaceae bacterium]|jgi:ferric-dicitrate binding protein FerR (iron transport regulator)
MKKSEHSDIDEIIVDSLAGNISHSNIKKLEEWRNESPQNEQSFVLLKKAWETKQGEPKYINYASLEQRIINEAYGKSTSKKIFSLGVSSFYKVAAAVAILLTSAITLYMANKPEQVTNIEAVAIKYIDKTTPKGARVTFKLSDGTTVNLNANSKLIYSDKFDDDKREVYLEGEGFFDVTENTEKPFIVTTGDIQTKVLGTTFNIKALSNSEFIEVALVTGSVSLFNSKSNETLLLKPDEMGTYSKSNLTTVKSLYNKERVLGWKDQLLTFSNTDFSEVVESLENWYGVSFVIKTKRKFRKGFTGKYKNKSLETVMKGLGFSYGFQFVISDKVVIIE